jgi:outer membrane protein assembly factor BamB
MLSYPLAVVPIVTSAGSAVLPTLIAAGGTFVGLLFKPRELWAACKRKPHVPLLVVAGAATLWGGIHLLQTRDEGRAAQRARNPAAAGTVRAGPTDWTRIALEIIQQQKLSSSADVAPPPDVPPQADETIAASSAASIYRGGPQRRGWDRGASPSELSVAWRYYPTYVDEGGAVVEDTDAMVLSTPLGIGDRVYGASCLMDPPDTFGAIFCIDAATGEQRWITELVGDKDLKGFFSSPALSADKKSLVIGQGLHPDTDCMLLCLDAQTGTVRWSVPTDLHIESSPAIEGNLIVVGCGAIENPSNHQPLSHPGYVLAVALDTGKQLWRFDLPDPESSPVIVDGVAYIGSGFNGNAVVALRTQSDAQLSQQKQERLLWKVESKYPITGAVTVIGDTVLVGGGNGDFVYSAQQPAGIVMAINKHSGDLIWTTELPDSVLGSLATDGDLVLCPVANGEVHALDVQTGEARWSVSANGRSPLLAGAALTPDSVYVVSKDGYLIRLSLQDGAVQEKHYLNNPQQPGALGLSISSPTVADGRVYVGSETGGLLCLQANRR